MMRSTELCEISRSCQSAIFSNAACALARTTRAKPETCSQLTGLRLCGMAQLPRCMTEALLIAAIFGKPVGDLETESNGLGVHAMSAADLRRVLKFVRALFQHFTETL